MSNVISQQAAGLAAQCASYRAGIATFLAFVADQHFVARDDEGRSIACVASGDAVRLLKCIEADAADAADRGQSGIGEEALQLLAFSDGGALSQRPEWSLAHLEAAAHALLRLLAEAQGQQRRLQGLEAVVRALLQRLQTLGFGDEDAEISGADAVEAIGEHFPLLRDALAQ